MSAAGPKLWSWGAGPGSWSYSIFDAARQHLNRHLAAYLCTRAASAWHAAGRTLEAGSGPGYCSSVLATLKPETRATLLDFDGEPLALAAARDRRLGLVKGDLYRLPFSDETFDLVFNSSTMEHLDSFAAAFGEMVRVTRRGGWLFVGVPYRYGPFFPFTFVPSRHAVSVWMGTLFSSPGLRAACRASGVVVEDKIRYFGGCFVGLLMRRETG